MEERIQSLDLIKILALLGVISLHTSFPLIAQCGYLASFMYATAACSIPLFFMVNGYLNLNKKEVNYKYSLRKIGKIIKFVFIISILFFFSKSLFNILKNGYYSPLDIKSFISLFLMSFIQKGELWMFWFLGSLCLLYIVAPFLHHLLNTYEHIYITILIILFLFESFVSMQNSYCNVLNETHIIQTFRLWNWLFYYMLGGIAKKINNNFKISYFILLLLFLGNFSFQLLKSSHMNTVACEYFYCSVPCILVSLGIFLIINQNFTNLNCKYIYLLSNIFLPAYILHVFIIAFYNKFFYEQIIECKFLWPLFFWLIISLTTISISIILMKIPLINKIFKI